MVNETKLNLAQLCHIMRDVSEQLERPPEKIDWARVREDMAFAKTVFERVNDEVKDCDGR